MTAIPHKGLNEQKLKYLEVGGCMKIDFKSAYPSNSKVFQEIYFGFVLNCPSSIEKTVTNSDKSKKKHYQPVSLRGNTFRKRNIVGKKLRFLISLMKKRLPNSDCYRLLEKDDLVSKAVEEIERNSSLADPNFEFIVYKRHPYMPQIEAIFYYIRNAFAHGGFEVVTKGSKRVYLLQSAKEGNIKAIMRLKEETLRYYLEIASFSSSDVDELWDELRA